MWRQLHLCLISSKSQGIKQESVLLFTTWKGTWHVFYLAQSGNWITITMEYLARLFQPTFKSKQLVFRGTERGALLPWGSLSPSPQHPPPRGWDGDEATTQPRGGILQDLTSGSISQRCQKCSPVASQCLCGFPLCAGCYYQYINPLWVSLRDSR